MCWSMEDTVLYLGPRNSHYFISSPARYRSVRVPALVPANVEEQEIKVPEAKDPGLYRRAGIIAKTLALCRIWVHYGVSHVCYTLGAIK